MKKILVAIVNYGDGQLNYLNKVIDSFKSFNPEKYQIDIVVHSNIPIGRTDVKTIIHTTPPAGGWNYLPWTTRKTIYDNKDNYDLFLYTENDHLYKESHIDEFLKVTERLPEDLIAGFIQYEEFPAENKGRLYPAYHANYEWDFNSVQKIGDYTIAHFSCEHHAGYLLTKKQLHKVLSFMGEDFLVDKQRGMHQPGKPGYDSNKVRCCTDVYTHGGMKKVIPISHFDKFLLHHLPNKYLGVFGNYSFDLTRMQPNLKKMLESVQPKRLNKQKVIYTCVTDNYDKIREPKNICYDWDYVLFTDKPEEIKTKFWHVIKMETDKNTIKIYPFDILEGYELYFWIESTFEINCNLNDFVKKYGHPDAHINVIKNDTCNCIYDEASNCISKKLDLKTIIDNQMTIYFDEGYPLNNGLVVDTSVHWKLPTRQTIKFSKMWLDEISNHSKCDQLSFNYVDWKYNQLPFSTFSKEVLLNEFKQ